jgi:O-antigen/teichoic acid export membrane protein
MRDKNLFIFFIFSIATSALGFISVLVLIRLIAPSEFGRIAIFFSLLFLVAPVLSVAADSLIAVNKSKLNFKEYEFFRRNYVSMAYIIFLFLQLLFLIIYAVGVYNDSLFLFIPIVALLKYLINLATNEYIMEKQSVKYGLFQFLTAALSLVLTVSFMILMSATADLRILALIIADLLFIYVRYRGRMHLLLNVVFDSYQWRDIIRFGLPLLVAIAPAWLLNEADKLIVFRFSDIESVGMYAAACAIGGFTVIFNTSLLNATIPNLYAELAVKTFSVLVVTKRFMLRYILASTTFAIVFAAAYAILGHIILPEKYLAARSVVYWVILFSLSRSFYAILGAVTEYFSMTIEKLKGITIGALAALLGMFVGILNYGIAGVAVGIGVGYFVLSISLWLSIVKKSRLAMDTK